MWGVFAAALAISPQVAPTMVLPPVGQWLVEGENNMCVLSHAFGTNNIRLAVRPWPLGYQVDLVLIQPGQGNDFSEGTATVSLGASGPQIKANAAGYAIKNQPAHLTQFTLSRVSLAQVAAAPSITIALGKHEPMTFNLPDRVKAFAVLDKCQKLLLKSLGIESTAVAQIVSPPVPKGDTRDWFGGDIYPSSSLINGTQGNTSVLLTITAKGRVEKCDPFGHSGDPTLDLQTCATYKRHGVFIPARNKDGRPVIGYFSATTRWRIW